jgi:hypothetical protein
VTVARVVRLLDPPEPTPRQLAQRKYQKSLKGRQAARRAQRKKREDAAFRAAEVARVVEWQRRNALHRRVYKRVWYRTTQRVRSIPHIT